MLPYCGVYTEMNLSRPGGGTPNGWTQWYDLDTLNAFRLLYPHSAILTTKFAGASARFPVSTAQFAGWKLTPMVEDYQARLYRDYFKELIANHMSGNLWK